MTPYEWFSRNYWDFNILVWALFGLLLILGLNIAETNKFKLYVTFVCIGVAAILTLLFWLLLFLGKSTV